MNSCCEGWTGRLGGGGEVTSARRRSRFSSVGLHAGVAVVVMVLLGGCSPGSTEGEPAGAVQVTPVPASPAEPTPSDVEPPRRPQDDFCEQVDYGAGSTVFGELSSDWPSRTITSEDDYLRCLGEFKEGYASVDIWIHGTVAAATEAFEGVAIFLTAAPYPGGGELSADQLQFRRVDDRTIVELRVENLFVEVSLYPIGSPNEDVGPRANEVAASTAAVAKSVLEVLSETE